MRCHLPWINCPYVFCLREHWNICSHNGRKSLQRGLPGRSSCVLAGAAEWAVLIVYSLNINCCLMLLGVTGTALSTKRNANLQHMYSIRQILWAVLFSSLFITFRRWNLSSFPDPSSWVPFTSSMTVTLCYFRGQLEETNLIYPVYYP